MTGAALTLVHGLGVGLILLALVVAASVVTARTHFATIVCVVAMSMLVALALLCFGADQAALAVTLLGVGVAPLLLLGGVLLSTPAIRTKRHAPWPAMLAVAVTSLALIWATRDVAPPQAALSPPLGLGQWLALLVFIAAIVCAGLLGYGERGALERTQKGSDG
jgi:hypothetical protein